MVAELVLCRLSAVLATVAGVALRRLPAAVALGGLSAAVALGGLSSAVALGGLSTAVAAARGTASPTLATARLQGSFLLAGHVTVAKGIRGEHVGENVIRTWTFSSPCPSGQCPTAVLIRQRQAGTDTLTLVRRGPGQYAGTGSFSAPLRCAGLVYPAGELVPFTITVQIVTAITQGGTLVASRLSATYTNSRRTNLTPCVAALGHDAASYHGHVI